MAKSLWHKFTSWIKNCDFFGIGITFNIKGEKEFETRLGGWIFIIYVIVTAYFLTTNFFSFYDRSSFNQNTNENIFDTAPRINLLTANITFAFGWTVNKNSIPWDNSTHPFWSHITQQLYLTTIYKSNNTKTRKSLQLKICTKDDFLNLIDHSFDLVNLGSYYCIDKSALPDLNIQGIFTDEVFSYWEYAFKINSNDLNTKDFLENFLLENEVNFQIYHLDTSIKLTNFTQPKNTYWNSKFIALFFPYAQKANWYVSENTFENDANIIFPSSTIFNFTIVELFEPTTEYKGIERLTLMKNDWDLLCKIYIRASQKNVEYKRIYQKFTEYLADSTAILSEILFILMLFMTEYNRFQSKGYIINNMLMFKDDFKRKHKNEYVWLKKLFHNDDSHSHTEEVNEEKEKIVSIKMLKTRTSQNQNPNPNINTSNWLNIISRKTIRGSWVGDEENKNDNYSKDTYNIDKNSSRALKTAQPLATIDYNKIKNKDLLTMPQSLCQSPDQNAQASSTIELKFSHINKISKQSTTNEKNLLNNVPDYRDYLPNAVKDKYILRHDNSVTEEAKYKIKFSLYNFIIAKLNKIGCCRTKDMDNCSKWYEICIWKYYQNLDIFSYLRKIREIDILKANWLNKKEMVLVDFLGRPSISLLVDNEDSPIYRKLVKFGSDEKNVNEFYEAFIALCKEYKETNNEKILKLLNLTAYEVYQLIENQEGRPENKSERLR